MAPSLPSIQMSLLLVQCGTSFPTTHDGIVSFQKVIENDGDTRLLDKNCNYEHVEVFKIRGLVGDGRLGSLIPIANVLVKADIGRVMHEPVRHFAE